MQEKRNVLAHRIANWQKIQDIYMPSTLSLRPRQESSDADTEAQASSESSQSSSGPEKITLFLPSACPASIRLSEEMQPLMGKETQLRVAQAYDALSYIKKLRRILVGISAFKHQNISGTGGRANTRVRSLYEKFQGRIKLAAQRYRMAYTALLILDQNGSWSSQLRVLHDTDIRGPDQDADDESEGKREHSWIWLVGTNADPSNDDSETMETMRVEWGKTWARAQRWAEEVKLLQEEMRRVLEYFKWKAAWWRSKAKSRNDADLAIASGLSAYSEKQAVIVERLGQTFAKRWSATLKKNGLHADWQGRYDNLPRLVSLWEVERMEKELDKEDRNGAIDNESEEDLEEEEGEEEEGEEEEGEEGNGRIG